MKYCVALYAGNGGWNCKGEFDDLEKAEQYSEKLNNEGFRTTVIFRKPWCGTINL